MRRLVLLAVIAAAPVSGVRADEGPSIPARAAVGLGALRALAPVHAFDAVRLPALTLAISSASADSAEADEARRFHPTRYYGGLGAIVAADAVVMMGLSDLWYSGERVKWHWYSDAEGQHDDGWLDDWHTYVQQDKLGHFFVSWQLARVFGAYGRWAGLSNEKAGLFGGIVSAAFQTQIEFFDGFDAAYGASRTDIAANVLGGVIGGLKVAYPEKLAWFEAKYSYHRSPYYDESVSDNAVLGYLGNAIKDYDGISYWLVVHPEYFLSEQQKKYWPDWLGLSIGYSGTGLAHPISGLTEPRLQGQNLPNEHHRQVFFGPDFDLIERIPVPDFLKPVRTFFAFVRIPAPALEVGGAGVRWHWLYY